MKSNLLCGVVTIAALVAPTLLLAQSSPVDLPKEVADRERAFAKTMADRDHTAFTSFLSDEAVFVGTNRVLRGKQQVADGWKPLYQAAQAPFTWRPEQVLVLESGTLALSSGPVLDATGELIGTFNSIWRREADGTWRIIFDKGCPACAHPPTS